MQYEEFIDRVRQRAGFGSSSEAEVATRETLATLGEYLVGYEGLDLASQLPQGLAENLRREPPNHPMIYSFPDFLQEIGEREGGEHRRGFGPCPRRSERAPGGRE